MNMEQKEGFWVKVRRKLLPDYYNGVYLGQENILICQPLNNEIKAYPIQKDMDLERRFQFAISMLRKYFKRWPPLRIVLCSPLEEPRISKEFLQRNAEKYNCALADVDFRICIAIGGNINVNESKKQIVLVFSETTVYGYIIFASNIISSAKANFVEKHSFKIAENLVAELKNLVKPTSGQSNFSSEINAFILKASYDLVGETIPGHLLIFHKNVKDCIGKGLAEIAQGFSMYRDPISPLTKKPTVR